MSPKVILVHGLWLNGLEMFWLGRRLRRCGFEPVRFRYADTRRTLADNARRLQQWLQSIDGEEVHFVAHSLGGILLLDLFRKFPGQRPGRVVLLGSPVAGSEAARRLSRLPLLGATLGRSVESGLLGGAPAWDEKRDLGVVSGTLGLGMGRLLGGLQRPHDGTVAQLETRLPGARQSVAVRAGHFGLLVSAEAARQVCAFLRLGRFDPAQ
jgi:pimeloyl-ACP methyl ester carboxylesterase